MFITFIRLLCVFFVSTYYFVATPQKESAPVRVSKWHSWKQELKTGLNDAERKALHKLRKDLIENQLKIELRAIKWKTLPKEERVLLKKELRAKLKSIEEQSLHELQGNLVRQKCISDKNLGGAELSPQDRQDLALLVSMADCQVMDNL